MSTAIKAIEAFLNDDNLTGQAVELSQENIYFREILPWANESQKWIGTESQSIWDEGYATVPEKTGY